MFNSLSHFYNPLVIFVSWQTIPVHETSRPSLRHTATFTSVSKSTVQDKVRNKIYFFSFKITTTFCSCRWGETMSLNCGHQRVQCSSLRWYMTMQPRWNDADSKTEKLRERSVPVPRSPPQNPYAIPERESVADE
jgi:hypothetical protein